MKALTFINSYKKTLIWSIIILFMCLWKPNIGSTPKISLIPHLDKVVHAAMHFLLVLFMTQETNKKNKWKQIIAISIIYGAIIELLQHYVFTWRSGDFLDLAANIFGAITAYVFFILIKKYFTRVIHL